MKRQWPTSKKKTSQLTTQDEAQDAIVLTELRALITGAQTRAAVAVNRELVLLYWDLGHRIRVEILREERADYGERIVATLSAKLVEEFGKGYSRPNLVNMMKFADLFPDRSICQTLSDKLSWSHFVAILRLDAPIEREFYATLCHASGWSANCAPRKRACRRSWPRAKRVDAAYFVESRAVGLTLLSCLISGATGAFS